MKKMVSYALGCKVNQYESEAIGELFASKGYEVVSIEEKADVYVINTCTVTNFGDKKSRQIIRRVKRQNPEAIVVVVGCYAQTAPDEVMQVEGVNLVIGTKDKNRIVERVEEYRSEEGLQSFVTDIMQEREFEPLSIETLSDRTRAYIKIQDGCSQFCSYCIIPYARGPIRSRNPEDVLKEVQTLAENGYREVVLTGIHVASYGKDLHTTDLLHIIKKVHEIKGIERIRLSSIEPNIITEEFAEEISKLPKVCDHFHLSLQSGCDKTLKAMNRKYTTKKYREATEILRKYLPDVALTTDIIVGFPGETEEDFLECYEFAKEIGFSKIHIFPYSPKKGTPAAERIDQISNEEKAKRSKELTALAEQMAMDFMKSHIGKTMPVLFERSVGEHCYEGHTTNYMKVHMVSEENLKNRILMVTMVEAKEDLLLARSMDKTTSE
ncbi:MAG: tRNA (N(6)-L-threonylcarbamoyladenosine(37)-C(2))-methylthiotransferase MtaB [Epulopiscium sp.]|nr:tRNA (N(6)-L-threonylcarbamoyladenosine(37)-C(2))-methylthiotransferase MtaB [Candidatus Epulonipiscium sp.]